MDRTLRARVLLTEAQTLGLTVEDLVAAAAGAPAAGTSVPTVSEYLERIEPTISKGTLRTYKSYWRLAERLIGDRPLNMVTVDDIDAVVVAAARRAQQRRPGTDARSPEPPPNPGRFSTRSGTATTSAGCTTRELFVASTHVTPA